MKSITIALLFITIISTAAYSETYSWEDESGLHFVDDLSKVPKRYRQQYVDSTPMVEAEPTKNEEGYVTESDINEFYEKCKVTVSKQLKAPATAKYGLPRTDLKSHWYKGNYVLGFYVDAQNSYGALIRNSYTCTVNTDTREVVDVFGL